jgi:(2Fe-2S) ferredoxin
MLRAYPLPALWFLKKNPDGDSFHELTAAMKKNKEIEKDPPMTTDNHVPQKMNQTLSSPQNYEAHMFVCTNSPEKEGKCGHKGGHELRMKLRELVLQQDAWKDRVRVNAAGCLGACEKGITVVIYPQAQWYYLQTTEDVQSLFQELKKLVD